MVIVREPLQLLGVLAIVTLGNTLAAVVLLFPPTVDASLLTAHVAIVGYGRVGRRIAETLRERRIPFTIAEQNASWSRRCASKASTPSPATRTIPRS
jgi:voltage-gated potassium channel Kch